MKPFVWYVRPGGVAKDKYGVEKDVDQYGVRTGIKDLDFSIYLESPRHPGNQSISFANFEPDPIQLSYYSPHKFEKEAWEGKYLWFLVGRDLGRKAIKKVFER